MMNERDALVKELANALHRRIKECECQQQPRCERCESDWLIIHKARAEVRTEISGDGQIDANWISELACYGFDKIELNQKAASGGYRLVLAYVMGQCDARKADDRWRQEIEKYFPELGFMSFCGPDATIRWLMERVDIRKQDKS